MGAWAELVQRLGCFSFALCFGSHVQEAIGELMRYEGYREILIHLLRDGCCCLEVPWTVNGWTIVSHNCYTFTHTCRHTDYHLY